MSHNGPVKAQIIPREGAQMGIPIECLFNPKEYTFSKQNQWSPTDTGGKNTQNLEFKSGQAASLQMQLFFDTYERQSDVRVAYTDRILALMMIDPLLKDNTSQRGRPPKVAFQWGHNWMFDAVITSITQKFTLFLANGTPVRATLDVSFQQASDPLEMPAQNPTSGGVGGEHMWNVSAGDTLAGIAYRVYGNPTRWRRIAEANQHQLTDVRRLTPGMILVIPNA